jgi:hypothetical protein
MGNRFEKGPGRFGLRAGGAVEEKRVIAIREGKKEGNEIVE